MPQTSYDVLKKFFQMTLIYDCVVDKINVRSSYINKKRKTPTFRKEASQTSNIEDGFFLFARWQSFI